MTQRTPHLPDSYFWSRVEKTETCWLWTGNVGGDGYGRVTIDGRRWKAHRFAMAQREDVDGLEVDHMCHTRLCVNPDHLQAVSRKANSENLRGAHRDSATGVRGVSWVASRGKYKAQVTHLGRTYWGGNFATIAEADGAVRELRMRLHENNLLDRA